MPALATPRLLLLWLACWRPGWARQLRDRRQAPAVDFFAPEADELEEEARGAPASRGPQRGRAPGDGDDGTAALYGGVRFAQSVDVELFRRRAAYGNLAIITVANNGFYPVVKNWLETIDALKIPNFSTRRNVTVVSMDRQLKERLGGEGYESQLMEPVLSGDREAFGGLSFVRHVVAAALSRAGLDVFYSDADTVWLQNPLPELRQQIDKDGKPGLVSSRGHYPYDVAQSWGATVNTGVLLYYGRLSEEFWAKLDEFRRRINNGHDQMYVNAMLGELGIAWSTPSGKLKYKDARLVDRGYCEALGLRVKLLPYNAYPRVCDKLRRAEVKILHCTRDKSASAKVLKWQDNFEA